MKLKLAVIAGPHKGKEFGFEGHDTFLVGRTKDAHFQLSYDDPYFSRRHFLLEVNPPRCRLINLSRRNGTLLNGSQVEIAEVNDGDEIGAGHTVFKVQVAAPDPDDVITMNLSPAAIEATADYLPAGPVIPGYRIEDELGRGGMGVVYRARRNKDGASIALKTIAPAPGTNRRQIERFLRESRILSQLQHDHIVAFREVGEAGGVVYLAMDLIDGPNLSERLREIGRMDVRTSVRIMCQVLGGLAHAHGKGFVHRDLKPSNILIAPDGAKRVAKLGDFGLARAFEASQLSGVTMQGEIGGTPAYMAPEQVTHYRDVKPTADQYSAAATLYKLLTDQYTRDLPKDVGTALAMIVTTEPTPILDRRPDLPPELATVIHRALSREPAERFSDATAFRTELKRFA